ncbi:MAG: DUF5979 domain-containing protein [Lachnospiraceae bacterium]|nr:DUF5979 domain-containing protein [Lachnospiraceae bacterium]
MKRYQRITPVVMSAMMAAGSMLAATGMPVMAATAGTAEQDNAITFTKEYDGDVVPTGETISFYSEPYNSNPTDANLTVDDLTVAGKTNQVTVDLPSYTEVGVYRYIIGEEEGKTQGETYGVDDAIIVSVLVSYDDNGGLQVEDFGIEADEDGKKEDTITNTYESGSLSVTKNVTGNLGDTNKEFNVTVTFNAESGKEVNGSIAYTDDGVSKEIKASDWNSGKAQAGITVKNGETVTFTNIPAGVTYEVVETEANQDGYTTSYDFSDTDKKIANADQDTAAITNNKGAEIDTGINMNNLPYILIAAGIAAVAVLAAVRRRFVK